MNTRHIGHLGAIAIASTALFGASSANAQPAARAPATHDGGDYEYWFNEDTMNRSGFAAEDGRITIRTSGIRVTLIRPRTEFVAAMLKSVENM